MKSILQSIALLSAAILVASCDSSSGGGAAAVIPPQAPQVSATGSAVKGIIDGATVTAVDADGDTIASTVVTNGTYNLAYDAAQVAAGITDPITITITGGSTICDYDNPDNSGNDCPTGLAAPNDFATFGESYDLPADFVIRSIVANASEGGISHVSPLSEIALVKALEKANGTALTPADVTEANRALSGLIEAITGISLDGVDFTQVQTANLAATGAVTDSPAQLALAAFAAGVIGSQQPGETLAQTITRLAGLFTIDADGNITGSGTNISAFATAVARGLAAAAAARPNGTVSAAVGNANANAALYASFGAAAVKLPPSAAAGSAEPIDQTKAFVIKLSQVIGEVVSSTGAQGFGGQANASATEAFASELEQVRLLSSTSATQAQRRLDAALKADAAAIDAGTKTSPVTNAVEDGETADDDGLEYVLTKNGEGDFTVTGVSSRWPLDADAATAAGLAVVTLTGATASSDATSVSIPEATLTTTVGTTTLQTFVGSFSAAPGTAAGTEDLTLTGTVTGQTPGVSFSIDASLIGDSEADDATPTYSIAFTFSSLAANDLTLTFAGTVGSSTQGFTIASPAGAINGSITRTGNVDVNTLTDGSATLTLTLTDGNLPAQGTIGTFSVGTGEAAVDTATLDANGVVTYDDGSIQALPAIIFPDPAS